eukprot:9843170-Lingulodinium_polyedra.AAC.1
MGALRRARLPIVWSRGASPHAPQRVLSWPRLRPRAQDPGDAPPAPPPSARRAAQGTARPGK